MLLPDYQEFTFTYARSSGPGGQNVNKVNTKVYLHWDYKNSPVLNDLLRSRLEKRYESKINKEGLFVISSEKYRSQDRNRSDCISKIASIMQDISSAPKVRRKSKGQHPKAQRIRLKEKKKQSEKKKLRKVDKNQY